MSNAFIPRAQIHAWSEDIGNNTDAHAAALPRLLRSQRRLGRFIEENQENLDPNTAGVSSYLVGVVARMFELAGGQLKSATWAQVREAEAKVMTAAAELLPYDASFADRFRAVSWRSQPHILDEAIYSLFERKLEEGEEEINVPESLKVFLLLWVATEVLDLNWKPGKGFEGEAEYAFTAIEAEA
ncbi:MAG: hypothetical protein JXX28_10125 [Deltaproteobacteria bacterium]|nr:hypothetical protein [Deltaproteobacteria bacterium]